MDENLYIRSSAAEYLIFSSQAGENGIEVRFEDGTAWLTQNMIGKLFDVESNTITYHIKEIVNSGELDEDATTRKIRVVRKEGNRDVTRELLHYN